MQASKRQSRATRIKKLFYIFLTAKPLRRTFGAAKIRVICAARHGGLSAFRAGGWREAKMGDVHGLAQWPEILAFAGSQV
jgi:hypothetical protein